LRERQEILEFALICGTLGFRASLEVTSHVRCRELSDRLLPWLEELSLDTQISPLHREILGCPHASLPADLRVEAYWRGESASLFGWSIGLFDQPDPIASINPNLLVERLRILRPGAVESLQCANLRSREQISGYCGFCLAVRNRFQMTSLGSEHQAIFDSLYKNTLEELGLSKGLISQEIVLAEATRHVANAPGTKGLYVVRAIAAEWLLGKDEDLPE
jgi:hypothetical protein